MSSEDEDMTPTAAKYFLDRHQVTDSDQGDERESCARHLSDVDDATSALSSETEGPDTHSMVSGSSETGGPDSDTIPSDEEDGEVVHDERMRGMVIRKGDSISFVSDSLNEQIKSSSPSQSVSRSSQPSSITSDPSPMDQRALAEIEAEARTLGSSVDNMLSHLQKTVHTMSAITVGCMQTYKGSVEKTLDEVDANIKLMYTFMARCEQLNTDMKDLYPVADQINDIKRILDMFEADLHVSPSAKQS